MGRVIKTSILVIITYGLIQYGFNKSFNLNIDEQSEKALTVSEDSNPSGTKFSYPNKQLSIGNTIYQNSSIPTEDIDVQLEKLHLREFEDFLNGEDANEHYIMAFYTDELWSDFYERLGYQEEYIEQLMIFRAQYLADISQSGREFYYSRWSDAPHRTLSHELAYEVHTHLGNGHDEAIILSNSILNVASKWGVKISFIERLAKEHLLVAIKEVEGSTWIGHALGFEEPIKFNSTFVDFLEKEVFKKEES
tara:strand:+ start:97 stop:846 length:750 start_codon:yes stop_codon:yes gene_type:complete